MVPVLGVFWLHKGKVYGDEDILQGNKVVTYGDYMQLNCDHFVIWNHYAPMMGLSHRIEYDRVPRGRVLFHIPTHHYIVIGSKAIVEDEANKNIVLKYFGLPGNTEFRGDIHYQ